MLKGLSILLASSVLMPQATRQESRPAAVDLPGEVVGDSACREHGTLPAGLPEDPAYHLQRVAGAFDSDCRHIFLGDSFVNNGGFNRVSTAMLKAQEWSDLNAVTFGVRDSGGALLSTAATFIGPGNPRTISSINGYGCEYLGGGLPNDHYGLPVRNGSELWANPSAILPPDGVVWTSVLQNSRLADGATPRVTEAGDILNVRLIHRRLSDPALQYPDYRLASPGDGASVTGELTAGELRQAAAGTVELAITSGVNGDPGWTLGAVVPGDLAADPELQLDLLGFTAWTQPHGQHFSCLGDNSWTYGGHGEDAESTGGKRYSTEQLRHWLAATTVNPAALHVFWIHCDVENADEPEMLAALTALRDKLEAACGDAGIESWRLLVLVPYMHERGSLTEEEMRQANADLRNAARSLADADQRVCVYSLYDATDGVMFDGSPEAQAWLADHGYDAFTYGSHVVDLAVDEGGLLLDGVLVHPRNQHSAAFFASLVARAIEREGAECQGNVDESGAVGFGDILLLLSSWGPCPGCAADIDEDGVVGFTDLVFILSAWGPCV